MGYEILQTFQFGREKEIPVGVEKAAILLRDGMEKVLQLKLKNNSNKILNELAVKLYVLMIREKELENRRILIRIYLQFQGEHLERMFQYL